MDNTDRTRPTRVDFTRFMTWVVIAIALFGLGIVAGLLLPGVDFGIISAQTGALEEFARILGNLPPWAMMIVIFLKNASAVIFGFVLSPFFLLMPIASLVLNGWVIGAIGGEVVAEHSLGYLLAGLLPHGVFELPAFIIGQAAALTFGVAVMQAVVSQRHRDQLGARFKSNLKYLVIAIILLVPAAIIETYFTTWLLSRMA